MNNNKLIPKLRFREFDGEWESCKLNELCKVQDGTHSTPNYVDEGIPFFSVDTIINNVNPKYISKKDHEKLIKRCKPKKGDILLSRITGGILGYPKLVDWDFEFSIYVSLALLSSIKIDSNYLNYYIQSSVYRKDFLSKSLLTASPPKINLTDLESTNIKYPKFYEQKKIANFFFLLNKKIELLENKYQLYKNFKKYLMQQIFAGKLRFKTADGEPYGEWKERNLYEFLTEHKLKSTGKEEVYSVSVHKGLVNQKEHLGRDFSAPDTSKYNLVKPGDIVYTKSPTGDFPLGIIKQSRVDKNVIVSPLYGVFTPETYALGYILNDYFESNVNTHNYLHPIVQKGAKNTMNITNKTFLSKTLFLPTDVKEQQKIAECLSKVNDSIKNIEIQQNKVNEFKKGLLQQMFVCLWILMKKLMEFQIRF